MYTLKVIIMKNEYVRRVPFATHYANDAPEYIPVMSFSNNMNEIDVIESIFRLDMNSDKGVTIIFFRSPPGLGKTTLALSLAKKFKCPYQVINCESSMTGLDLIGSYTLIDQETVWVDGPLPAIVRATNSAGTGVLVINEINLLNLQAQVALNPLMDRQQEVVLTMYNNEVVKVSPGAHLLIIASMNPDIIGVNEIQDSVVDRADLVINMDYPTPEKEASIVSRLCNINESSALEFASIIYECRQLKTRDHKISRSPSTRGLIDWIRYAATLGVETAYELAVVNKYGATDDERDAMRIVARGKGISDIKIKEKVDLAKIFTGVASESINDTRREEDCGKTARAAARPVTPEDEKTIIEMRKRGARLSEIAEKVNKTTSAVYRCLKRNGIITT